MWDGFIREAYLWPCIQKSDEKGFERFGLKTRYNNGRVMAREAYFYQCLWETKLCAKFGRSRIPRTVNAPHSKPFATSIILGGKIAICYIF